MAGAGAAGESPAAGGDNPGAPAPAAAPGPGTPGWRDWAAGLPGPVLARVAEKLAAQLAPRRSRGLTLMLVTCKPWKEAMKKEAIARAGGPEVWRDWGNRFGEGLPTRVLVKVAEKYIALAEQRYAADLERQFSWGQRHTQYMLNKRRADGNCLYPFARVGKGWRKAQRQVGGRLRTRLKSDIVSPGRVELVRWALAEGCPRERALMAYVGAERGHVQVVQWVVEELDFNPDRHLMSRAAIGGKLELVQWLRARGCPWDAAACAQAAEGGSFEVLQWLRAQGCPWNDNTCAEAAPRPRRDAALGPRGRARVERVDRDLRRHEGPPARPEVAAGPRLPLGPPCVRIRRGEPPSGGAALGPRERLPVGGRRPGPGGLAARVHRRLW